MRTAKKAAASKHIVAAAKAAAMAAKTAGESNKGMEAAAFSAAEVWLYIHILILMYVYMYILYISYRLCGQGDGDGCEGGRRGQQGNGSGSVFCSGGI